MSDETLTLKQMMLAVLQQSGEQLTYRHLTTAIWNSFPAHREHIMKLYGYDEKKARQEYRIRLGIQVKNSTGYFSAAKSDGIVLVGLAATTADALEEEEAEEEEEIAEATGSRPSVYWYTFPAYQRETGAFPIKIGRGNNPELRIAQQVTAMPEAPVILGMREHMDSSNLERALHAVLALRNKRKTDAPGTEWFMTTPNEIGDLIDFILVAAKGH
jgi:hypothetical protein